MMYIHYCTNCRTIRMLNGHKSLCPACGHSLREQKITFTDYTGMSQKEREQFLANLRRKYS